MLYKFFTSEKTRTTIIQLLLLGVIISTVYYLFNNAANNLEQQGIASGFEFLNHQAGFDIIMHLVDYNESSTYLDALIVGLLNTLLVSILGIIFASIIGFIIGIARLSRNWLIAKLASIYIEIFRNIPLLLQIFFWYFAVLRTLPLPRASINYFNLIYLNIRGLYLPQPILDISIPRLAVIAILFVFFCALQIYRIKQGKKFSIKSLLFFLFIITIVTLSGANWQVASLQGFNLSGGIVIIPELMAMLIALSVYTAAFIAEIVRAGITSIPKGQIEAAKALGLKQNKIMRLIVIPQALRVIIPPLTSQYLNLTKNSSLAAAIAYPDLVAVFAGTTLNQTGQAIEVIGITMTIYLIISLTISLFMNWYNKKIMLYEAN